MSEADDFKTIGQRLDAADDALSKVPVEHTPSFAASKNKMQGRMKKNRGDALD